MPKQPLIIERVDTLEHNVRNLQQIVCPDKVNQYKQELTLAAKKQLDLIKAAKDDFKAIVETAETKEQKAEKLSKAVDKFHAAMTEFKQYVNAELEAANARIADAHNIAQDIETKIRDVQDKVQKIEENVVNNAHKIAAYGVEAAIRDMKDKMEQMEKNIAELGNKIMNVAIYQAEPRGRSQSQTSRQRSQSLQTAARIMRGKTWRSLHCNEQRLGGTDDSEEMEQPPIDHAALIQERKPSHLELTLVQPSTSNVFAHSTISGLPLGGDCVD